MQRHCPQCQNPLTEFAPLCEKCGWSVVNSQPRSATDSAPTPQSSGHSASSDSANGDSKIQEVIQLIEQEDYSTALTALNHVINEIPVAKLGECYSLRGYVQLKNLDFGRAEDDCTEAINHGWEEAQTFAWRAAARGEQNKWRLAFDDLDRACEIAGPHRDQYLDLMESYSETASDYFREKVKAGLDTPDMFFERGWIYFRSAKYERAERDFQQAVFLQPRHPWASVGLARLQMRSADTTGVGELCEAGLEGDQECQRRALRIRALLHQQQGNIGLAKLDLDRLSKLAGDSVPEQISCARIRTELGDQVSAIDELTSVLEAHPSQYNALYFRGNCYSEIRNSGLAIADYTRYLEYYPEDVQALLARAKVNLAYNRYRQAHADLDRLDAIDTTIAQSYLVRSKTFLAQKELDKALSNCRRAVRLDDQRPEAFAVLADIYNRLCDYGNAIEEYSRSIELAVKPDEKAQYLYMKGISNYELGDFEKSLKDFKKSCQLRPNHAGCWIWNAATCARVENWSDAILGLQQAILVRPSAAEQYQKLGKPVAEKAIAFFNRQQQRGYEKSELFSSRGMAYQFLGKSKEAIEDFSTVIKRDPQNTDALIRRGQVYTQHGDHDSAIRDFTEVIRDDKKNHRARYCRAISRLAEGRFDDAKRDLKKSIKAAPGHPRYHILLGELKQKMGDGQGVIDAFDRAIMQDPTNPVTYRRRGTAYLDIAQHLNAISDFTRSLDLDTTQYDLMVQRGQTYLKTGQPLMAIEDFELALTHNASLAKAYSGRAACLVSQGRHEYTLIWLTKAIHRFKKPRELSEIVFARGKVYYQMGRTAPAIADFSSVIELMKSDPKTVSAAVYARAIASIHNQSYDEAVVDFQRLHDSDPKNEHFKLAMAWLADRNQPRPAFLSGPENLKRPTRPSVCRNGVTLTQTTIDKWTIDPPHDTWVLRTADKKEYGPIHIGILNVWASEGRLDLGMKLLRADWSKWKRVEKILTEVTPTGSQAGMIDEFPELDIGPLFP